MYCVSCTFIEQFITGFIPIKLEYMEVKLDQKGPLDLGHDILTVALRVNNFRNKNFHNISIK